ncbi:MAG: hypothetical protein P4L99_05835 [Chthoniobacter sp.]|nr:hypothetical protein [Chthoniobacter sp.]
MENNAPPIRTAPTQHFLFVGGGLGDVARRFYLSDTYELLSTLTEPTSVICFSHNPSARDFFRFHPNHRNIVLFDLGHIYMSFLRDPLIDKRKINQMLFSLCGFADADGLARQREPKPIGLFFAPDALTGVSNHIVVHPFGRAWGNWPRETVELVKAALRTVPPAVQIYVICADYIAADGRVKREGFSSDQANVKVLRNLSAPAVFSLVATASRFIGNLSSLAQVAAFERVPSVIIHPERCSDFKVPYSDYAKTIWKANGINLSYETTESTALTETLNRFFKDSPANINVREISPTLPDKTN